ncbi:MAG: lycopene cyclase domain-containing protein [Bacteroidota bacterium]
MKEYTICAVVSVVVAISLDRMLKTNILRTKSYGMFFAVMMFFKLLFNGYLTWRPIVRYGEEFQLGIRLFTIPLEDFLYGFGLMTIIIVFWEYFKRGKRRTHMARIR